MPDKFTQLLSCGGGGGVVVQESMGKLSIIHLAAFKNFKVIN